MLQLCSQLQCTRLSETLLCLQNIDTAGEGETQTPFRGYLLSNCGQ